MDQNRSSLCGFESFLQTLEDGMSCRQIIRIRLQSMSVSSQIRSRFTYRLVYDVGLRRFTFEDIMIGQRADNCFETVGFKALSLRGRTNQDGYFKAIMLWVLQKTKEGRTSDIACECNVNTIYQTSFSSTAHRSRR